MIYWLFTAPLLGLLVVSSLGYLFRLPEMTEAMNHLGYPIYVMVILGLANGLGALAILCNRPKSLKEWAYAGIVFYLIGAAASHALAGDHITKIIWPLIFVAITFGSYFYWNKS
jgi:hypothetical protein